MRRARRPSRLPRWQEWSVYISLAMLVATGVAWLLFDSFVRVTGEFGPEHSPAERWLLVSHGVVAYAFLTIAGAMIPVHITLGWNLRRNLKSGFMVAGTCLILAVTALGLYYLGDELSRRSASVAHWVTGLLLVPLLLVHALKGRRGH